MAEHVDTLIAGAGIVGAGVAYALRHMADRVYVLEAGPRWGMGATSRNSGVIHAGLYYPHDSLKMRLCRRGAALLYPFAANHGVPFRQCGKFIVANSDREIEYLDMMYQSIEDAGLYETQMIPEGIRARKALFSPNTGIIDVHCLVEALFEASRAPVLFNQRVDAVTLRHESVSVRIGGEEYVAKRFINCCGLEATRFVTGFNHVYARGSYFQVKVPASLDLPDLVYPAVPKGAAGLGIHWTRNLHGEAYLGPDVEWVPEADFAVDPHRAALFFEAARSFLPWLKIADLQPGYAGIRAKLSRDGFSDFTIFGEGPNNQVIHCLGIESPGLTAAMAIGEYVADLFL